MASWRDSGQFRGGDAAFTRGGRVMTAGTVQWFNASKGCGVVKPVDGGFNVFVRIDAIARAGFLDLKEGQIVNFDIVADEATGKQFAENVSIQVSASSAL